MMLLGPWGGVGGSTWSFNEDGEAIIKQIVIYHGDFIDSITFQHERGGKIEYSKFGGSGGTRTQIDFGPNEYLTNITGYAGRYVNSLKLITNIKQYGPFGPEGGSYFSTMPMQGGTIAGFHGRSGTMIDAIGVYKKKADNGTTAAGIICTSVFGGPGGNNWSFNENGMATIKQIVIGHGDSIDSITFKHELNGTTENSTFGGSGGSKSQIDFGTHEYITSVSGYAGTYVNALKLVTNEREYDWFGRQEGSYFEFTPPMKYGMIVGFHGRSGNLIDAIGAYIAPRRPLPVGPWGGPGGDMWTINGNGIGIIKQIVISSGSNSESFSLKFKLEVNGTTQYSQDFGASGSSKQQIDLDSPREYLTRISGYVGYTFGKGYLIIRSLRFFTNIKEYGPFGAEQGTYFTSPTGKIVGMFGRSGTLLDALGVFMEQA